jgi:hypothetical protein
MKNWEPFDPGPELGMNSWDLELMEVMVSHLTVDATGL